MTDAMSGTAGIRNDPAGNSTPSTVKAFSAIFMATFFSL
jgi:hypothetical protein